MNVMLFRIFFVQIVHYHKNFTKKTWTCDWRKLASVPVPLTLFIYNSARCPLLAFFVFAEMAKLIYLVLRNMSHIPGYTSPVQEALNTETST
jgi:hypothetical protein